MRDVYIKWQGGVWVAYLCDSDDAVDRSTYYHILRQRLRTKGYYVTRVYQRGSLTPYL